MTHAISYTLASLVATLAGIAAYVCGWSWPGLGYGLLAIACVALMVQDALAPDPEERALREAGKAWRKRK